MIVLRSLVFQALFYSVTLGYMLVLAPALPFLSRRGLWTRGILSWVKTVAFLLRVIVGTRAEVTGTEHIPQGPLLIAAKHQSAWETLALLPYFSDPAFILKRELMGIPLFGWIATKAQMIAVDRSAGSSALKSMTRRAVAELAQGRQIIIFPEGTRRPPGAPPAYKFGVAHLYSRLGVPCLPVALNSGLYWPRRELKHRAGTIRMEFLPVIPAGLDQAAFMRRMQGDIEVASDRLLALGRAELGEHPPATPAASGAGPSGGAGAPEQSPLSTPVENS